MRKIWLVIKREYLTRVRTKIFILSTIGLPLFSVGIFAFTVALAERKTDRPFTFAILDHHGELTIPILNELTDKLPNGELRFQLLRSLDQPESNRGAIENLTRQVREGELDGYLEIPKGILAGKEATLHTRSGSDYEIERTFNRALSEAVIEQRLSERGIRLDNVGEVVAPTRLAITKITQRGESKDDGQSVLIQLSVVMVLYITLLAAIAATSAFEMRVLPGTACGLRT